MQLLLQILSSVRKIKCDWKNML